MKWLRLGIAIVLMQICSVAAAQDYSGRTQPVAGITQTPRAASEMGYVRQPIQDSVLNGASTPGLPSSSVTIANACTLNPGNPGCSGYCTFNPNALGCPGYCTSNPSVVGCGSGGTPPPLTATFAQAFPTQMGGRQIFQAGEWISVGYASETLTLNPSGTWTMVGCRFPGWSSSECQTRIDGINAGTAQCVDQVVGSTVYCRSGTWLTNGSASQLEVMIMQGNNSSPQSSWSSTGWMSMTSAAKAGAIGSLGGDDTEGVRIIIRDATTKAAISDTVSVLSAATM